MRKMIDLLRAGKGVNPDGKPELLDAPWQTGIQKVIIADNVAAYNRDRSMIVEDLPCLRPPWEAFWIEYPSTAGGERRGVLCYDPLTMAAQEKEETVGGMITDLIKSATTDAIDNGHVASDVVSALGLAVHIGERDRTIGPVALLTYVLDYSGRAIGNRWVLHPKMAAGLKDAAKKTGDKHSDGMWCLAAAAPALQTIAFLHCKNVVVDTVRPEIALSRKWQKRTGKPLATFSTVRLDLPRKQTSERVTRSKTDIERGLHIVAGHFAHFGDCCPGAHPERGKLFGKYAGVYWISSHARGNADRGVVLHDFEVAPLDDSPVRLLSTNDTPNEQVLP